MSPARRRVRALILTPTRELADQVYDNVRQYASLTPLRSTVVFGGMDMDGQTQALRSGVEVLVATPGRLLDHVQQKNTSLGQVEVVVLDEADRMLAMGFLPDISRILNLLPRAGVNADAIHGDKTQEERMKALEAFKNGSLRVLVATDVAARGLDITELPAVINYDVPFAPEDYIHRIGRTARAGAQGRAITIATGADDKAVAAIEKLIKRTIEKSRVETRAAPRRPPRREEGRERRERRPARSPAQAPVDEF